MVKTIRGVRILETVTEDGRCPHCGAALIVRDKGYTAIKNRCFYEFEDGGQALLCKCGQYVNRF